jgi:hypothetical protein
MADTMYAWSRILYGVELSDDANKSKLRDLAVEPGEEVTAEKLNVTDEQFQELVDGGAVRNYPFPKDLQDPLTSPNTLIAQGLADSETVAATVGVSPELVDAYIKMRKSQQTPSDPNREVGAEKTSTDPRNIT